MPDTHPDNKLRFISRAGTLGANTRLPVNEWSHVTATLANQCLRLYLNGTVIAERNNIPVKISPSMLPLRLDADSEGGSRFSGLMDEVRIWNRALSETEVKGFLRTP